MDVIGSDATRRDVMKRMYDSIHVHAFFIHSFFRSYVFLYKLFFCSFFSINCNCIDIFNDILNTEITKV